MSQARVILLVSLFTFSLALPTGHLAAAAQSAQAPPPVDMKKNMKTVLVLSPEFCETKKVGEGRTFDVGYESCDLLKIALKNVFLDLAPAETAPPPGTAGLVLTPRFVEISFLLPNFSIKRELVLIVEWTAKDDSGRTVWLQTVQGSAKNRIGGSNSGELRNVKLLAQAAAQDLANKSVGEMAASPELQKFSR
jgi:hypothetical protein